MAKNIDAADRVDCMQFDTDGDGYISCTLFDSDSTPTPIECASFLNSGCRLALPIKMNGAR